MAFCVIKAGLISRLKRTSN